MYFLAFCSFLLSKIVFVSSLQIIIRRLEDESSKKTKKKKKRKVSKGDVEEFDDEDECNYMFVVNRWFAKSEDDGQIVRELVPTDSSGNRTRNGSLPRKLLILWLRHICKHARVCKCVCMHVSV